MMYSSWDGSTWDEPVYLYEDARPAPAAEGYHYNAMNAAAAGSYAEMPKLIPVAPILPPPRFASLLQEEFPSSSSSSEEFDCPSLSPPESLDFFNKPVPQMGCPDYCAVCGDKATGHHYDVPSCNGCKTFFRRTILAQRRFTCRTGGNCFATLPKAKRVLCRACRFNNCVDAGMNPLGIITGDDFERNELVKVLVAKRKQKEEEREKTASQVVAVPPRKLLVSREDGVQRLIEGLLYLELKHDRLRKSTYNPRFEEGLSLEKLLTSRSMIGKDLQDMPNWPMPTRPVNPDCMPVTEYVRRRIKMPELDPNMPDNFKIWYLCDVVFAVEYVRTLDFFHQLDYMDQIALLKNAVHQCINITSSYFSFANKSDIWIFPDGRTNSKNGMNKHVIPTMIKLNVDRSEYVLIKALLLCNPSWSCLSDRARELMAPMRERCSAALMLHCLSKRGPKHGPEAYATMLSMIDNIQHQTKTLKESLTVISVFKLRPRECQLLDEVSE